MPELDGFEFDTRRHTKTNPVAGTACSYSGCVGRFVFPVGAGHASDVFWPNGTASLPEPDGFEFDARRHTKTNPVAGTACSYKTMRLYNAAM